MLTLDKKTITDFEKRGIKKIKIFFYAAGCSGTKIDITEDDFEIDESMLCLFSPHAQGGVREGNVIPYLTSPQRGKELYPFDIYVEKKDIDKFENATITRTVKADHTWKEETRYIYSSEDVLDRCGCWTSFSFEKKKPKINLEKLKTLKIDTQK